MTIVQSLAENTKGAAADNAQVLVVTASSALRQRVTGCLGSDVRVQIIHEDSGIAGVTKFRRNSPDVVILDVDGETDPNWLTTIGRIRKIDRHAMIIMISASTDHHNIKAYTDGLARGAADFLAIPAGNDRASAKKAFDWKLSALVHAFTIARRQLGTIPRPVGSPVGDSAKTPLYHDVPVVIRPYGTQKPKALAIASSTGGPRALMAVLSVLPRDIGLPIFITQHMPRGFTTSLAQNITSKTDWLCHEGVEGMEVLPGYIYLAPGGFHMELERSTPYNRIRITDAPPENFCKPSADPMIRSLIKVYGGRTLLTVLTGMGSDGVSGAKQLVEVGGTVIAQDQATSVVWGMPGAVATNGLCSAIKPIDAIAGEITRIVQGKTL